MKWMWKRTEWLLGSAAAVLFALAVASVSEQRALADAGGDAAAMCIAYWGTPDWTTCMQNNCKSFCSTEQDPDACYTNCMGTTPDCIPGATYPARQCEQGGMCVWNPTFMNCGPYQKCSTEVTCLLCKCQKAKYNGDDVCWCQK
jgi:hypothetical protein